MITKVTITGADDKVKISDLSTLSRKFFQTDFPTKNTIFLEYGILFSSQRQGQPRYPTDQWLRELTETDFPAGLSFHLCGNYVRDITQGNFTFGKQYAWLIGDAGRMQLNMTDDMFMNLNLNKLQQALQYAPYRVILTTKREFAARADEMTSFQLLFDPSGGKGKKPQNWPKPVKNIKCGYAGGLNPDNLKENIEKINEVSGDVPVWIDVESGVRDENDQFDLDKVNKFLEIAQNVCSGNPAN